VQGVHWNNNQATVHPFAIYFRNNEEGIGFKSLVMISECSYHATIAVHVFQRRLVDFLKENLTKVKKKLNSIYFLFYLEDINRLLNNSEIQTP